MSTPQAARNASGVSMRTGIRFLLMETPLAKIYRFLSVLSLHLAGPGLHYTACSLSLVFIMLMIGKWSQLTEKSIYHTSPLVR